MAGIRTHFPIKHLVIGPVLRLAAGLSLGLTLPLAPSAQARPVPPTPTSVQSVQPDRFAGPVSIKVGTLTLRRCLTSPAYCGDLPRPIDPTGKVPGTIPIHFEFYPHRNADAPRFGTIVAAEGGPGYASTLSRDLYRGIFEPLMDTRDLVLVDNRGTGSSHPVSCPGLQNHYPPTQETIRACGAHLGLTSDLYGTGLATDDMAAVLDALQTGPVDLYGDSYGTFYSETFAGRHPDKLRSLMLDGTFQVEHLSPWYPANAQTMRNAFDKVCARAASCNPLPGTTLERVQAMLEVLRKTPLSGTAPDGYGNPTAVTLDPGSFAYLMFSAAYGPLNYRELDPAIRAYLDHGDALPLLRMRAETYTVGDPYTSANRPRVLSEGLYIATSCTDYPQIYDMTLPPALRWLQRNAALAEQQASHPDLYAPFTITEFNGMPIDFSLLDLCLNWPVPSPAHPPQQPVPPHTQFPSIPVLVLSGELDSLTSPISGAAAAALFPNSRQIIIANSFHVTADADPNHCADKIIQNFVLTLTPGDTSCSTQIAEIRPLPNFAKTIAEVAPATALAGNAGTPEELQLAATMALTAGDALNRWWSSYDFDGVGLRGGTFTITTPHLGIYIHTLNAYRWTEDAPVNGTVQWNYATGKTEALLTLADDALGSGTLTITWDDHQQQALATLSGTLNGHVIAAQMVAP